MIFFIYPFFLSIEGFWEYDLIVPEAGGFIPKIWPVSAKKFDDDHRDRWEMHRNQWCSIAPKVIAGGSMANIM